MVYIHIKMFSTLAHWKMLIDEIWYCSTVNIAHNDSAYKELSVKRNWFSFPDLSTSLLYIKHMDIADSVIRNYRLEGTHFPVLMLINQSKVRLFGTHFWSSSHLASLLLDNWQEPRQYCYRPSKERLLFVLRDNWRVIGVSWLNILICFCSSSTVYYNDIGQQNVRKCSL